MSFFDRVGRQASRARTSIGRETVREVGGGYGMLALGIGTMDPTTVASVALTGETAADAVGATDETDAEIAMRERREAQEAIGMAQAQKRKESILADRTRRRALATAGRSSDIVRGLMA